MTAAYHIVAYPNGRREVVGTVYGRVPEVAMWGATVVAQAAARGEFVDVERASDGRCIAVVSPDGEVSPAHSDPAA